MTSEFHKKAVLRITAEKRACMVKSLEVISQIHSILERKDIKQNALAALLKVSPAAVSKMLTPGSNLELHTIAKLEILLGETIITTPQIIEAENNNIKFMPLPRNTEESKACLKIEYVAAEENFKKLSIAG